MYAIDISRHWKTFIWNIFLAHSTLSDMSSPNHTLDSPNSDEYSTASTGVPDTSSIGGIAGGDVLTTNFKSNHFKEVFIRKKNVLFLFIRQ